MKFLIIEDGDEKIEELQLFLKENNHDYELVKNEKDAKNLIQKNVYDMIFLDMELPCSGNSKLSMNKYSGITIMNSMRCYNIDTPVLLFTQYTNFLNMSTDAREKSIQFEKCCDTSNEEMNTVNLNNIELLEQLHEFMSQRYPNYIGVVHYCNVNNEWKKNVMYFIDKIGGNKNEGTSS